MLKLIRLFVSTAIVLFSVTSCWQNPVPAEGLTRCNSKTFRYRIDYPSHSCKASSDNKDGMQILEIMDVNKNFMIHVLALKTENDKRFKFDFYPTADTLYYKGYGSRLSEGKNFFNDRILRTYSINDYLTLETTSIYGGQCIYIIYSKFNEQGKAEAEKITNSFRSSSGVGAVNFCKRKIYSILGDNWVSTTLSYFIFSLLFTFIFWIGLLCCFSIGIDNLLVGFFAILLFIAAFGYIALTDEFMGYLYGHNNLWELIEHYLIMVVDEG